VFVYANDTPTVAAKLVAFAGNEVTAD